jgi:hypothetical protein
MALGGEENTASVTKILQIFSFYQAYMEFFVSGNFTF